MSLNRWNLTNRCSPGDLSNLNNPVSLQTQPKLANRRGVRMLQSLPRKVGTTRKVLRRVTEGTEGFYPFPCCLLFFACTHPHMKPKRKLQPTRK